MNIPVEPLSLDDLLDVTKNKKTIGATLIAQEIKNKIFDKTGLRASAGISVNKFIAKVASDINKPNGRKQFLPMNNSILEALDIRKFYGIGKVTATKMYHLGIFTGKDLKSNQKRF